MKCYRPRATLIRHWYNPFVLHKIDSSSTSRPDFWKTVKDLLGKHPCSNAPLIRGDTVYYDMTSKAKIFNEYFTSISTASDSILSKVLYFLGFICILIYAFLPSQSSPLMFTMYYYLLIVINRKILKILLTDSLKIALNLLPLLSVFSSALSQLLPTFLQLRKLRSLHDVKITDRFLFFPLYLKFLKSESINTFTVILKPTICFIIAILDSANATPLHLILELTHKLLVAKDSGCSSRVVFLTVSKAFDKVIHSALLFKLRQLGVIGSVYNLLRSYLSGRSQFVRLDFRSDHLRTNCGVPQGSVLGPLLFYYMLMTLVQILNLQFPYLLMILCFYVLLKTPAVYIIRYPMIYVNWRCGPICGVLLQMLQKPKFLPLQIIHLFILHYDSATKL